MNATQMRMGIDLILYYASKTIWQTSLKIIAFHLKMGKTGLMLMGFV